MNIAVFGGSFDPPHVGHVMIVDEALKALHVEKLFVVPTFLNPFKDKFSAPAILRYKWLCKIFKDNPKVEVLDFEIRQKRQVPSIETIKYLIKKYNPKKIYLIIGADNYAKLHLWKDYDEKIKINANISSSELREDFNLSFIPKCIKSEVKKFYIRKNMKKRVENIVNLLNEKKAEDIQTFDMSAKDYFVNSVVIATTLGERHGLALLDYLKSELKNEGEKFLNIDESDDWVILDMGDILVHLMSSQYRAKYNIEEFLNEYKSPE